MRMALTEYWRRRRGDEGCPKTGSGNIFGRYALEVFQGTSNAMSHAKWESQGMI